MTALLDIAALSVLLLVLTFVPALGLRAEARITAQLRAAEAARAAGTAAGTGLHTGARAAQSRRRAYHRAA